jgi:phenylalanine-4-hydroxylase
MSHLKQNIEYSNLDKIQELTSSSNTYKAQDQETWSYLYNTQLTNLEDKATPDFLGNLKSLMLPHNNIPSLSEVSDTLMESNGWEVVEVNGLINNDEFFNLLANKKFPSTTYIRGNNELNISKDPDIFHELFGHVPMLMNDEHAHYMQQIGKFGISCNDRDKALLQRLYWFVYEVGLIQTKNGMRIIGGSLLSSIEESKQAFANANVVIKSFSLKEVLRTPYRADKLQNVYFVLNNIKDFFDILDKPQLLKNTINEAYHLGEYPASFIVENTKYESVRCCKYIVY